MRAAVMMRDNFPGRNPQSRSRGYFAGGGPIHSMS